MEFVVCITYNTRPGRMKGLATSAVCQSHRLIRPFKVMVDYREPQQNVLRGLKGLPQSQATTIDKSHTATN